jgi:hypothetical protein
MMEHIFAIKMIFDFHHVIRNSWKLLVQPDVHTETIENHTGSDL